MLHNRAIALLILIARSKLVPDFAITIHLIDLVVTSLYTKAIPSNVFWWTVRATSTGVMIGLGIWGCRWRELQPMNFGGHGGTNKAGDEGGDYEMAPVEE